MSRNLKKSILVLAATVALVGIPARAQLGGTGGTSTGAVGTGSPGAATGNLGVGTPGNATGTLGTTTNGTGVGTFQTSPGTVGTTPGTFPGTNSIGTTPATSPGSFGSGNGFGNNVPQPSNGPMPGQSISNPVTPGVSTSQQAGTVSGFNQTSPSGNLGTGTSGIGTQGSTATGGTLGNPSQAGSVVNP
jgi:hypothetical protein